MYFLVLVSSYPIFRFLFDISFPYVLAAHRTCREMFDVCFCVLECTHAVKELTFAIPISRIELNFAQGKHSLGVIICST